MTSSRESDTDCSTRRDRAWAALWCRARVVARMLSQMWCVPIVGVNHCVGPHRDGADSHRRGGSCGALCVWRQHAGVLSGHGNKRSVSAHLQARRWEHLEDGSPSDRLLSAGSTTACLSDVHPFVKCLRTGYAGQRRVSLKLGPPQQAPQLSFHPVLSPFSSSCIAARRFTCVAACTGR